MSEIPVKFCEVCGRQMTWRKKWRNNWDEVRFCSKACRTSKLNQTDLKLENAILHLLKQRRPNATICPSEAARKVAGYDAPHRWRPLMQAARNAARRLYNQQKIIILQEGSPVNPSSAKGPIRIKLK